VGVLGAGGAGNRARTVKQQPWVQSRAKWVGRGSQPGHEGALQSVRWLWERISVEKVNRGICR